MTPPRVRSLERMEGRRPGVRGGAGRRPISPRAPERRVRGPPGALGSPAALPSDILPGREEGRGNKVNPGDGTRTRGRTPPTWPPAPQQCVPSRGVSAPPRPRGDSQDHPSRGPWRALSLDPRQAQGRRAPQRTPTPHNPGRNFSSGTARSAPRVSAWGGSLRGGA